MLNVCFLFKFLYGLGSDYLSNPAGNVLEEYYLTQYFACGCAVFGAVFGAVIGIGLIQKTGTTHDAVPRWAEERSRAWIAKCLALGGPYQYYYNNSTPSQVQDDLGKVNETAEAFAVSVQAALISAAWDGILFDNVGGDLKMTMWISAPDDGNNYEMDFSISEYDLSMDSDYRRQAQSVVVPVPIQQPAGGRGMTPTQSILRGAAEMPAVRVVLRVRRQGGRPVKSTEDGEVFSILVPVVRFGGSL